MQEKTASPDRGGGLLSSLRSLLFTYARVRTFFEYLLTRLFPEEFARAVLRHIDELVSLIGVRHLPLKPMFDDMLE